MGSKDKLGYGRFHAGDGTSSTLTHHFAWNETFGYFPKDCLLHKCDNPSCCNPSHLFEGDRKANVDDMIAKGRMPRGEQRGHSKLDREKVVAILCMLIVGERPNRIASLYGVNHNVILGIEKGTRWKHIPRA